MGLCHFPEAGSYRVIRALFVLIGTMCVQWQFSAHWSSMMAGMCQPLWNENNR